MNLPDGGSAFYLELPLEPTDQIEVLSREHRPDQAEG
jgi:hypothetical protein